MYESDGQPQPKSQQEDTGQNKEVGSLYLDGIAGLSIEDPHAAPPAPRC